MRFIAFMAVCICCMTMVGFLNEGPIILGQPFSMIATLIAGTGFIYVLSRG